MDSFEGLVTNLDAACQKVSDRLRAAMLTPNPAV